MCLHVCLATTTPLPKLSFQNTCIHSFSLSRCPVYGFIKILSPAVALAAHGTAPTKTGLFVYKVTQPSLQSVGA